MPALQRARRRLRPRVARDEGGARRRRVGREWSEGVDHVGPGCRLRHPARAHRSESPQEQGHHLLPGRHARARRRRAAAAAHQRRDRIQRGVPRPDPHPRLPTARRRQRRLARRGGDPVERAADGGGSGLGWERTRRGIGRRSPAAGRANAGARRRSAGAATPRRAVERRAHPSVDEPTGRVESRGRPDAGPGGVDRQGAPGGPEPAGAGGCGRPARRRRDGVGRRRRQRPSSTATRTTPRCPSRWVACSGAAPTPSREARPR